MKTIWKFKLKIVDEQIITAPGLGRIVCVGDQLGQLCAWANVDTDASESSKRILIRGTGTPTPTHTNSIDPGYLGTSISYPFVWHVFDAGIDR
jgi:hypothetical protein